MNEEELQARQIKQAVEQGHPKGLIIGLLDILIGHLMDDEDEKIEDEIKSQYPV